MIGLHEIEIAGQTHCWWQSASRPQVSLRLPSSCFEVDGYRNRTKLLLWPTRNDCLCQTMVTGGRGGSKYDATHDAASMETMCTKKKSGGSGKQQSTQDPRVSDGVRRKPQNQLIYFETMMGFRRWRCDLKILSHSSSPWKLGGIACPAPHLCMSYRGTNARPPNGMRTDLEHTSFNVKR